MPVREHRIEVGEIVAEVMGTGTLEARVKSTVSPKIAGRIEKLLADQGDQVKAGQLLFTLDDAELKQQVEIAQANIASAQAALDRLQADQAQTAAVLEQARQNNERVQKLVTRAPLRPRKATRRPRRCTWLRPGSLGPRPRCWRAASN